MARNFVFALALFAILSTCLSGCILVAFVDNRDCSDTTIDELHQKI